MKDTLPTQTSARGWLEGKVLPGAILMTTLWLRPLEMPAQGMLELANPHWNITLTDYGYSDYMLDNTPGFEGREYLSGEWGMAVGYRTSGGVSVGPEWLEPHFLFPDWDTGSTFQSVTPLKQTGVNADGLPIAESVIGNGAVEITLRYEMLDTITGTPMGISPASAGDAASLQSDRYVLKQTSIVKNVSAAPISNLQLFQFLHGLHSQRGVYDDRFYAGPLSEFQHDVTLAGVDPEAVGAGSSSAGLEDFLSFQSSVAPSAFEVGYYGIEGNGVDAHAMGKPSEGVHRSIEDNWQHAPYNTRQGRDEFAPTQRWISGGQRWELGNLAAGQSARLELLLTLRTGTKVTTGNKRSGGCDGGASVSGGVDYEFEDVTGSGSMFGNYSRADETEVAVLLGEGKFDPFTFMLPGGPAQIWQLEFSGTYSGKISLKFGYDGTILPPGLDQSKLCLYEWTGASWQNLNGVVNVSQHTISVTVSNFSVFALGVDSENVFEVSAAGAPVSGGAVTGGGSYADGSSATLVATASSGYVFANWTEGGATLGASPNLNFVVHSNRWLVANFVSAGSDKTVTTSALPANGGSTTGDGAFATGESATVVAAPLPGYKFSKWVEGDTVLSTSASYTFTVEANRTLIARFKPVYTILTTAAPPDGGEISADTQIELGELAVLKAKPNSGYSFVNWTQNGVVVSVQSNYQFTATANRQLVAHFALGHRLDVSAEPLNAGTVIGGGVYQQGSNVVLTATAHPGYVFVNWTEKGVPMSTSSVYSFSSSISRALVANFVAQPRVFLSKLSSGEVVASWPAGAAGWVLQQTPSLGNGSWQNLTNTVVEGDEKRVFIPAGEGPSFFRLNYR